ncbi:xanthine dehydrogenase accessory protein XdhC [Nitratireductor sp. CAU 1489]|uniref:Xanthine dehydrogenase accessory protein XdhC n=1 Tax=Nitratireductor arenosus TaxID=2682096 RepID=A0A844Q9V0_9HYPH|nr:xanthine dehydrogenase accessory protein XdhC [Nitratireductor arenosus]MVA95922.1 xanthine dehydrogenase accessory protein XdhC [Nitratireductor arenosus]
MTKTTGILQSFLDAYPAAAKVEVTAAKGSTPREEGAWMLVAPDTIFGTIGGGQLEFMAIDEARALLRAAPASKAEPAKVLDIPLGPEIGQCCGGRVGLSIERVGAALRDRLLAKARAEDETLPRVLAFGGGHVGRALAEALVLLPVRATVAETRADAIVGFPEGVETRLTAVPEELVRAAPAGAAFVVLTHDHALDFLIVSEALKRGDAAYVGMIGSATKKATFRSWFLKTAGGSEAEFSRLVTPIGGDGVRDKRPAVIAALAAAEIMTALVAAFQPSSSASR